MRTIEEINAIVGTQNKTILATLMELKGCQFIRVAYMTIPKMPKTRRETKAVNPFYGRVVKYTAMDAQYGYSYENAVNNRLERQGDARDFKAETMKGAEWIEGYENRLCISKDGIRARFYRYEGGKSKSVYLIDGKLATPEEMEELTPWLPTKRESAKQADAGLEDRQVQPFAVYVDNILMLHAGGKKISADAPASIDLEMETAE